MLKDFTEQDVSDGDEVVFPSPYFPTLWVVGNIRNTEKGMMLEYIDSKKRVKYVQAHHRGQFVKVNK